MDFEWDDKKSHANLSKHGIDFKSAKQLWNDENRVEIEANFPDENRKILIGKIIDKTWAVIFTYRKKVVRIISVRRARIKEINLYEREKYGKNC